MTKQEFIHCSLCGGIVKDSESHNAEPLCEGRCSSAFDLITKDRSSVLPEPNTALIVRWKVAAMNSL